MLEEEGVGVAVGVGGGGLDALELFLVEELAEVGVGGVEDLESGPVEVVDDSLLDGGWEGEEVRAGWRGGGGGGGRGGSGVLVAGCHC